jgi:hypothetical protein
MANPAAPQDANSVNIGFGIYLDGAADAASWLRILNAAVVADETTKSGSLAVASMTLHDAADPAAEGPVKIGGKASAAAPTDVTGNDRVNAWFLLNGAQATVLTAAGALIGGDATRGLDVNPRPHTAGGLSTFNASGADSADNAVLTNTAVAVKASAGQLYGWFIYNPNDEACFVNFYDIAQGSTTVGTSATKLQLSIPAGAAANLSGAHGIPFGTAITVSATKTAGSNTAPDTGLDVQLLYK